ncbi:MAG: lipocalin-like domain-containing protein [Pseudomonadota bacterium]
MNARKITRRRALASLAAATAASGGSGISMALAQGFAGLGTAADGFALPDRGRALVFPADHGAHPRFRIEWWYLTANLTTADGREGGIQWTLFRAALAPEGPHSGWRSPQVWLGHAGVTLPGQHLHAEVLARGGIGQAGVRATPFAGWIDDWEMRDPRAALPPAETIAATEGDALDTLTLHASGTHFSYRLGLRAEGPLVLQGDAGYSVKSPAGQASHYYSQPFYRVEGVLRLPDEDVTVSGQGWLDREWSSQPLADTQDGWDWISLHLDTGAKMMGFRLRDRAGAPFTSATFIAPTGAETPYSDGALAMTPLEWVPVAGRDVPIRWRAVLPAEGIDVTLSAVEPNAWMATTTPYWEGPVRIAGSHGGRGYLEMTGYAPG